MFNVKDLFNNKRIAELETSLKNCAAIRDICITANETNKVKYESCSDEIAYLNNYIQRLENHLQKDYELSLVDEKIKEYFAETEEQEGPEMTDVKPWPHLKCRIESNETLTNAARMATFPKGFLLILTNKSGLPLGCIPVQFCPFCGKKFDPKKD